MKSILTIQDLSKTYQGGFQALQDINLDIREGEIFALLGPNGAGKTTLIGAICGIVTFTQGRITVDGYDVQTQSRMTRDRIGLVPQELLIDTFATVWNTVRFSRGIFGKPKDPQLIEDILKSLSLWDKKDEQLLKLSGGMKRRVLIAKALSHEPKILFLDEPTAGVDVELRKNMWELVHTLRKRGVTIILTTHYIQEAEEMADRVGVINHGKLITVEEKNTLMSKMGKKQVTFDLSQPLAAIPEALSSYDLSLKDDNMRMTFSYATQSEEEHLSELMQDMFKANISWVDLTTRQSSLEEIFVKMVDAT